MHYSAYVNGDQRMVFFTTNLNSFFFQAASKNGLMTICPLDPLMEVFMGQREEPAFGDFAMVNRMYCARTTTAPFV